MQHVKFSLYFFHVVLSSVEMEPKPIGYRGLTGSLDAVNGLDEGSALYASGRNFVLKMMRLVSAQASLIQIPNSVLPLGQ